MTESVAELLAQFAGRFTTRAEYPGGEGVTLRVADSDGTDRVLKVLPQGVPPSEASVLLSLRHPAIPAIHEIGELSDGRMFVVREHRDGDALARLSADPALLLDEVRQILEVLAFVHLRSVVHLDLKPQNLVRDAVGRLHLLDFGLATRVGDRGQGGTPFFAAPELLLGAVPDPRADLFSVGAMVAQALWPSSRLPLARFVQRFPREDFWSAAGVGPSAFPAPFDGFLERSLARRPVERFQDAQAAIEFLCGGSGRPSLAALRPDPIELWRTEIEQAAAVAGDLVVRGAGPADRRAIAMHLQCIVDGVSSFDERPGEVVLVRDGTGPAMCRLPAIEPPRLAAWLGDTFVGLDSRTSLQAAELLAARGASDSGEVAGQLVELVERGEITPAGTGWVWPAAAAGRLGACAEPATAGESPARASATRPEDIRAIAAAGRSEVAVAAWRRVAEAIPDSERELRHALADGLLDAGEPAKALPFCADAPVLRVQCLLDMGQVEAAERELQRVGSEDPHPRRRRMAAQLLLARGHAAAAADGLAEADTVPELLTRAAALEVAGRDEESDATLTRVAECKGDALDRPYLRASQLTIRGHLARKNTELERAMDCFEAARETLLQVGHVRHAASAQLNLGVIEKDRGEFDRAVNLLREARALYEHAGDAAGMAIAAANLGSTALARGDAVAAKPWLETAVRELARLGNRDAGQKAEALLARATAQLASKPAAIAPRADDKLAATMPPSSGPSRELFRTFLAVNRKLAQLADLDQAMHYLLDAAVTLSGGRQGYLLVVGDDGVRREFQSGSASGAAQAFSRSLAHRAIERQATLTGADGLADRELQDMPSIRNLEVRSAICAPFRSAGGVAGALYVEHAGRADAFGASDKEALEVLADQAAIAVDRMRREEALVHDLQASRRELAVVQRRGRRGGTKLLGDSPAMKTLRSEIQKLAPLDLSILVLGETGTGKELVARSLHEQSGRRREPFVAENCSALPAELLERELFGHVQGAFTGADADKPGLLELASGGTLFLDEVGDMPAAMQAKLLRALQEQSIRRVGGSDLISLDLRVIAATHKDLRAMVASGEFREDLFFRLAGVELRVPPLRERVGDVEQLAAHFLAAHSQQHGRELRLGGVARAALTGYAWPGNVRELDHVMARAALLTERDEVIDLQLPEGPAAVAASAVGEPRGANAVETLKAVERRAIVAAMQALGGDKTKAAKALGISRTALYEKLKRHGID
ncbi:MAG: sigma 54-interacting transcriptional regulator [bacterium]|nr:sigma 54-interacting transcriptional regulator [bacterium]